MEGTEGKRGTLLGCPSQSSTIRQRGESMTPPITVYTNVG